MHGKQKFLWLKLLQYLLYCSGQVEPNLQHLRVVPIHHTTDFWPPGFLMGNRFITLLEITSMREIVSVLLFSRFSLLSLAFENSTAMSEFCCNVRILSSFGVCLTTRIFTTCISLNLGSLYPLLVQTFPQFLYVSFPLLKPM